MMTQTPSDSRWRSNLDVALALAEAGYWIFPVRMTWSVEHKKWDKAAVWPSYSRKDIDLAPEEIESEIARYLQKCVDNGWTRRKPSHIGSTQDPTLIRSWWRRNPKHGIGIASRPNGVMWFDADRHHADKDGVANLLALAKDAGYDLEQSPWNPTAGDGRHYPFAQDPITPVSSKAGDLARLGIDVRGYGGYVVAPGTIRPDGRAYGEPDKFIEAAILGFPQIPEFLKQHLAVATASQRNGDTVENDETNSDEAISAAVTYLEEDAPHVYDGEGRNDATYKVVCTLRDMNVGREKAFDLLLDHWNEVKNHPPYPMDRLQSLVENAYQYAAGALGSATGAEFGPVEDEVIAPKPQGFKTLTQFFAEFTPPVYLIDGIIQRSYLYALTARTGHGKTALLTTTSLSVAANRPDLVGGREIQAGRVLYLTFENPSDFRVKLMAACFAHNIDPAVIDDQYLIEDARRKPGDILKRMKADGREFALVVVDTLAAGFAMVGNDTNDAIQNGEYVRSFRPFMLLPGSPSVIIACHPVKNATKDQLIPYGSGALVNEFDANLTLWKNASGVIEMHWSEKIRGNEFDPLQFRLDIVRDNRIPDSKGRPMPLPVIRPVDAAEAERVDQAGMQATYRLLVAMDVMPDGTGQQWADRVGVGRARIAQMHNTLAAEKLVQKLANKWMLTALGKKTALAVTKSLQNDSNDFQPVEDD